MLFHLTLLLILLSIVLGNTQIKVYNNYKKELNIKIQGSGVGGCDVILDAGESNEADCWCLWGTINYSFCSYSADKFLTNNNSTMNYNSTTDTDTEGSGSGRCPAVTGESLVCSDLSSLGNCYDGAYSCTVDEEGLCHCETI